MTVWTFQSGARVQTHRFDDFAQLARITLPHLSVPHAALSGGATYSSMLAEWARPAPDLSRCCFFPVDERKVPFDNPDSNWGACSRLFLSHVGREADRHNHPASAQHYEKILRERFSLWPPRFDTVFLGVGSDGHTASLFPGDPALLDTSSVVLETRSPATPHDRITLGPAVLAAATTAVVVVAGEGKQGLIPRIAAGDMDLPIVRIMSLRRETILFVQSSIFSSR